MIFQNECRATSQFCTKDRPGKACWWRTHLWTSQGWQHSQCSHTVCRFASHTASKNVACRQEILIKHLWKSQSHTLLADLLLPYIHPLLDSHKSATSTHNFLPVVVTLHSTGCSWLKRREESGGDAERQSEKKENKTQPFLFRKPYNVKVGSIWMHTFIMIWSTWRASFLQDTLSQFSCM